jgi:riboflavin synthase
MFTGLVQAVGTVRESTEAGSGRRLSVDLPELPGPVRIGDSIALSGVCCTVVELAGKRAAFDLSSETLDRTWLGSARPGTPLNLEGALRAGDPHGGHLVQGHVDGVGRVVAAIDPDAGGELWAAVPDQLRKYCVEKGSITLDGVSLTIAGQRDGAVQIAVAWRAGRTRSRLAQSFVEVLRDELASGRHRCDPRCDARGRSGGSRS